MSTDPTAVQAEQSADPAQAQQAQGQQAQPSEEDRSEIGQRAAYEAEMSRISSADMILQATVSLLNIGGYRLGPIGGTQPGRLGRSAPGQDSPGQKQPAGDARDLEQVRDAIDGARALLPILERTQPNEMRPLRDALSQLQMAYARAAGASAPAERTAAQTPAGATGATGAKQDAPGQTPKPGEPGPAQSSGRLWVPGR